MPTNNAFTNWRKSSRSNGQGGQCVEVGFTPDGATTGIRDTKEAGNPNRGTLAVSRGAWAAFVNTVARTEGNMS